MQPPTCVDHLGLAVDSLEQATRLYRDVLGFAGGGVEEIPDQKVRVALFHAGEVRIELLEPTAADSPIAKFLDKNPDGGIHHVCYEVDDIIAARDHLKAQGARILGDGEPKIGAHDKPVLFLHPKDFNGTLVELEQA